MNNESNISYVKKDYNIDNSIDLPKIISYHKVNDMHLYIASEKASWISLNDFGKRLLDYFKEGFSIRKIIDEMQKENINKEDILKELEKFLIKIERKGFLETAVLKEEDIKIILQLFITNKCNQKCVHCYMDAGVANYNELGTSDFLSIIDEFSKIHKTKVVFSGGEPLIRTDFFELAKRAKERELEVALFTNGTLINPTMVEKIEAFVDEIQFSLDGATQSVNDKIRGKGVYKKVINAINLLKDVNIKKRVAIVLMPQNVDDFKKNAEELARSLENVELKFGFATTEGRANKSFKFKSDLEAEKESQIILEKLYKKRLKIMAKYEPNLKVKNCGYGEVISISSIGDIFPCAILKFKAGNIKKNKLSEVIKKIRDEAISSNVENLEKCQQCDLIYICFGGCRLNNMTHNNDILKPYCNKEKREILYKKLVLRDQFDALSIWLNQKSL
ncbi:MAG: radical SAM protein [Candidatus Aminicenantes bacterium]|nr:MAG: radical SAM protein [Candidatus Aminicenantes bacterium]